MKPAKELQSLHQDIIDELQWALDMAKLERDERYMRNGVIIPGYGPVREITKSKLEEVAQRELWLAETYKRKAELHLKQAAAMPEKAETPARAVRKRVNALADGSGGLPTGMHRPAHMAI